MGTGPPVVGCLRAALYARTEDSRRDVMLVRRSACPSAAADKRRRVRIVRLVHPSGSIGGPWFLRKR